MHQNNILLELVYTAKRILREEGSASLIKRSIRRLFRHPTLRWQFVIALDFSQEFPPSVNQIPVHVEELKLEDFDQVVDLYRSRNVSVERLRARLDQGEICYVIKSRERVVSLFWLQLGEAYSERLDRHYPLSPTEIYAYDSYTAPDFRGKGLSTAVPNLVAKPFLERGYRCLIGFVVPVNQPAKRAVKKRAFQTVGVTGFVELFGIRLYFHRSKDILKQSRALYFRKV